MPTARTRSRSACSRRPASPSWPRRWGRLPHDLGVPVGAVLEGGYDTRCAGGVGGGHDGGARHRRRGAARRARPARAGGRRRGRALLAGRQRLTQLGEGALVLGAQPRRRAIGAGAGLVAAARTPRRSPSGGSRSRSRGSPRSLPRSTPRPSARTTWRWRDPPIDSSTTVNPAGPWARCRARPSARGPREPLAAAGVSVAAFFSLAGAACFLRLQGTAATSSSASSPIAL